jgi:hypothetical protein
MVKNARYSDDALMDIFGTTGASKSAIVKWKASWRETRGKVQVTSFGGAAKILKENNIDPLYYQYASMHDSQGVNVGHYIVFYSDEYEFFFKLHYGVA